MANRTIQHHSRFLKTDAAAMLALTLAWIVAVMLINPAGEFPLNDDWSYTRSLQHLYGENRFKLEGWTSMPLVGHLLWGWLFCKIFGFSFTILRFSTLLLGLAGGIACYLLVREFTVNKWLCLFCAALFLFNPIWCNLSYTYMTDIPFTCWQLFAMLCFVRYFKTEKAVYILIGLVLIIWAIMIRQLGILAAGAFSIAVVVKYGMRPRAVFHAAVVAIVPLIIYLGYNHWLKATNNYPSKYDEGFKRVFFSLFSPEHSTIRLLGRQAMTILIYSGFFVFPLCLFYNWQLIRQKMPALFNGVLIFIIGAAAYCFLYKPVMPEMGNILNPLGIGPVSMRDVSILRSQSLTPLSGLYWKLFTAAGILGAGATVFMLTICVRRMILQAPAAGDSTAQPFVLNGFSFSFTKMRILVTGKKRPGLSPQLIFLIIFTGLYLVLLLVGGTYDRYLLPLVPVLGILLISCYGTHFTRKKYKIVLACILLFGYGVFSIAGTMDYLSWNRARWNAVSWLTREEHISTDQIDGGFEFNGYYHYNDSDISSIKEKADPTQKSWWWVKHDDYLLTFGPVSNYGTIRTFPFHRHIGRSAPAGDRIYVLRKLE